MRPIGLLLALATVVLLAIAATAEGDPGEAGTAAPICAAPDSTSAPVVASVSWSEIKATGAQAPVLAEGHD